MTLAMKPELAIGGLMLGAAFFPQGLAAEPGASPEKTRNVLFIAVDDLKPALGAYGDRTAITPNIDRLAARGVTFTNAHCQMAVCGPSRASFLTGLRPDTTRVVDLKTHFREALPDVVTFPQFFKHLGYRSIGIGKIFHGSKPDEVDPVSWTEPWTGGSQRPHHVNPMKGPDGKPVPFFADQSTECLDVGDEMYADTGRAAAAVAKLKQLAAEGQPFLLAVGFFQPHLPFCSPKKYWDLYDREKIPPAEYVEKPDGAPDLAMHDSPELRKYADIPDEGPFDESTRKKLLHGYYASVSYVDAQVGRVLDELDRLGLADNTVVVLLGDHGWHLGDHGLWGKFTNFEQSTRSPLIVAGPGLPAGKKCDVPVEFLDVYPTLCEMTGARPPDGLHGSSLVPVANGRTDDWKNCAVSLYPRDLPDGRFAVGFSVRGPRYRYTEWITNPSWKSRKSPWAHTQESNEIVATEFYDYETDPLEKRNLAGETSMAGLVSEHKSLLARRYQAP